MFRFIATFVFLCFFSFASFNAVLAVENNNYELSQIISVSKNVASQMRREGGAKEAESLMDKVLPVEKLYKQGVSSKQKEMEVALLRLRAEVLKRNAMLNLGWAYYAPAKNNKTEVQVLQFINRLQYQLHNVDKRIGKVLGD